jgi:hypothetical protein
LTVAQLGTTADDKEDDYDVLDDKSPSVSSNFPQKIQTTHSFSVITSNFRLGIHSRIITAFIITFIDHY